MSKTTHRHDAWFVIPPDATLETVKDLFLRSLDSIAASALDIDWANLEIRSERNEVYEGTFLNISEPHEYTDIRLTARGRK